MLRLFKMQITIVDDSQDEKCSYSCGLDWTSIEVIDLAGKQIQERFGSQAELNCLDLSNLLTGDTAGWKEQVSRENLSLPLLVIDGQPRISGQFDIRLLLEAIDAEMEVER